MRSRRKAAAQLSAADEVQVDETIPVVEAPGIADAQPPLEEQLKLAV
jgi:hypothetical protein